MNDHVKAPLYRLPTFAAEQALPQLIGSGGLSDASIRTLLRYYSSIAEFNRGLARAGDAHANGNGVQLDQEFKRLHDFKVPHIIEEKDANGKTLQQLAEAALR